MSKKPAERDEVPMSPLNVDIPSDMLDQLKLAKIVTKKPLRTIALEAFAQWLKGAGIDPAPLRAPDKPGLRRR